MSIRKRLSSEESRAAALEAARALLIEAGPQAVTLKAVAGRVGRTHANLLHHFGSASGLHKSLAGYLAGTVRASIHDAVRATQTGVGSTRAVVDLVFDAFDREGGAALAGWMLLTGNEDALDPIVTTIHQLVHELSPGHVGPNRCSDGQPLLMHRDTLMLVLLALGDALMGERLTGALALPRSEARVLAEAMLDNSLVKAGFRASA